MDKTLDHGYLSSLYLQLVPGEERIKIKETAQWMEVGLRETRTSSDNVTILIKPFAEKFRNTHSKSIYDSNKSAKPNILTVFISSKLCTTYTMFIGEIFVRRVTLCDSQRFYSCSEFLKLFFGV